MAPSQLTPELQSLPPMLHMHRKNPIASYSKGSRGLFVPSQEGGIFASTTTSPRSSLRQRSSRYTIRAGRNLPAKEFRYLRTVRVTAAVCQGFSREHNPRLLRGKQPSLTFWHRAGVSPYTLPCGFAETCVFVKQSLEPFHCVPPCGGNPFFRSYGVKLPSSLTRILSSTLGYSPRPRVFVYGTVTLVSDIEAFLG